MTPAIDLDKLTEVYLRIRDARTAAKREWEARDAEMSADQDRIKTVMLQVLNSVNGKSINTALGTVMRSEKLKPSAADWSAIYQWIAADPSRFGLLHQRLTADFIKQFMDQNEGQLPPGVNVLREYDVTVRRASA